MLHTLLINYNYEYIDFITERKVFKLLANDKVEMLEYWPDAKVYHGKHGILLHPAVLRLRYQVRWIPQRVRYSTRAIFRRDQFICQYCGKSLTPAKATIDHIKPKKYHGQSSWKNCVTACMECNTRKGDRSLEQAGLRLLKEPIIPEERIISEYRLMLNQHPSWAGYLGLPTIDEVYKSIYPDPKVTAQVEV